MTWTDQTKWTCPNCGKTVTVYGSPEDTRCGLDACMSRHFNAHAADQKARTRRLVRALDRQDGKTPTMKRKTA